MRVWRWPWRWRGRVPLRVPVGVPGHIAEEGCCFCPVVRPFKLRERVLWSELQNNICSLVPTILGYVFLVPVYIWMQSLYWSVLLRYTRDRALRQCLLLNLLCGAVRTSFAQRLTPESHTACGWRRSKFRKEAIALLLLWCQLWITFVLSNRLETACCSLSRCPGAAHRRLALERRKTGRTQTETESENGPTTIGPPGTLSPEADCSGSGTAPTERNCMPACLLSWTEEPGLDNPAFEENAAADSMCRSTSFRFSRLFKSDLSFLPTPRCLRSRHVLFFLFKK